MAPGYARGSCASRCRASASTTNGLPHASTRANSARAHSSWPRPGPIATTVALSSSAGSASPSSSSGGIASGRRASKGPT
ncbi:hypothetical protein G6F54_014362 [Rhizopus delemar]|nr:hypothetical protein G6F54_014362 [Rhizopus delemar]